MALESAQSCSVKLLTGERHVGGRLQVAAGGEFIDEFAVHTGGGVDVEAGQGRRGGQAGASQSVGQPAGWVASTSMAFSRSNATVGAASA